MMILEIRKLTKQFDGVRALDEVSLSFEKGKITGVVGPNGSGKTTLTNVLTGVYPFDSGSVVVADNESYTLKAHDVLSLGITRTFQHVRIFEQMTVLDNLVIVMTDRRLAWALTHRHVARQVQRAREILATVGLEEKEKAFASTLSYGQRKLLEIARVIAVDANVILFDEPFAGLFKEMVAHIATLLKNMRTAGKTIILIEHNMELIRTLCDQLIVMDSGTLLAHGSPAQVLSRSEVIEAYLGE